MAVQKITFIHFIQVPLMPFLPVTTVFVDLLMLVSIAERSILIAAMILPAIGQFIAVQYRGVCRHADAGVCM